MTWIMDPALGQKDSVGNIALCYYQTTNPLIEIGDHGYKFITKRTVCLAWVHPDDVSAILSRKGGCCGGKKFVFRVASAQEVRIWSGESDR